MTVTKNVVVYPITWSGTTVTTPTVGWTTFLANIAAFYSENSYGQFTYNFTVASTLTITTPADPTKVAGTERTAVLAAGVTAGFPLASYDVAFYSWPASVLQVDASPSGGEATVFAGKPAADIQIGISDAGRQSYIALHELGHISGLFVGLDYFGGSTGNMLPHSHAIESDIQFVPNSPIQFNPARMIVADKIEYGNDYCTMGSGIGHFTARQKDALGWMAGRTQTVSTNGSYTISNLEAASPVNPQALIVQSGVYTYWLEYRQPTGFDSFLGTSITSPITLTYPTPTGPLVYVLANGTLFDPTPPFGQFDNMAFHLNMDPLLSETPYQPLQQGRTFTAPDGMTITTTAHTSTTTTVTVAGVTSHPVIQVSDDYYATAPLEQSAAPGTPNDVSVTATDSNGQSTTKTVTVLAVDLTTDSSGPTVAWSKGGSNAGIDGPNGFTIVLSGTVTDPSGVLSLAVTQAGAGIYSTSSFPNGSFSFPVTLVTGANAFVATFTDNSAAQNTTVVSFTLTLALAGTDISPPSVGWIQPGGNITLVGPVGTTYNTLLNIVDPSGLQSVTIDGTAVTADGSGNVTLPISLAAGVNTITVVAVDNSAAHNSTGSLTHTITLVASLGPEVTFISPAESAVAIQGADGLLYAIQGQVDVTNGISALTVSGAPIPFDQAGNFNTFVVLRTGQNTVTVVATDAQIIPQSTETDFLLTLSDAPFPPTDIEISPDQIRMGIRIHERGLE